MDTQLQGGTSFSFDSLMTPNFVYFVITLAVIGYLYQTKMILSREQEIKNQSANLFDNQLYLEIGFMVLIGFCMYILNTNENNTFVWIYMLVPILYLIMKSLIVFTKVSDFIKEAPGYVDVNTDIMDLINSQNNNNNNNNTNIGQIPVTNQNSNTVQVTNALNQALGMNNNMNAPLNSQNNSNVMPPQQPMQPIQPPQPEGFSLF